MTVFRYQATNEEGQKVTGTVDAPDQQAAMSALEDVHMSDVVLAPPSQPSPSAPTSPPATKTEPTPAAVVSQAPVATSSNLLDTLRLYAAWLLAWYGLVMGLGYYAHKRTLSFEIPFVEGLFLSSLVFRFLLAMFLFLFISSLVRALKGGLITGSVAGLIGIAMFFYSKTIL